MENQTNSVDELENQTPADELESQSPADESESQPSVDELEGQSPADELESQPPADESESQSPAGELEGQPSAGEILETAPPEEPQYPVFSLSPDGQIISNTPEPAEGDELDIVPEDATPTPAPYAVQVNEGDYLVIPGGDGNPTVIMQQQQAPAGNPLDAYADQIDSIQSDIAYLASVQASNYGYLGSQALDTFDRVVQQNSYRYYCAFRDGSDTYNGVLYLSDHISYSGDTVTMEDAVQVRVYRSYNGNTYYYYYSSSSAGDVAVNLSGNLMYYTNTAENYPTLGGVSVPYRYPSWVMPVLFVGLLAAFFAWRKRS